ncbi:trigger factor-like [Helianthus annuus]|uniref:trigger factor-like n=1 Tax=Helianthus annuus TaxID=4232 RepID=UPI0016530C82|nr:trigger factor-like [Helianthus annuus]
MVTSSKPVTITEAIDLSVALTEEAIRLNKFSEVEPKKKETHVESSGGSKRKFSNFKQGKSSDGRKGEPSAPVQATTGTGRKGKGYMEDITLEKLDDFSFVNDELVKKLQKKVEADQADIDILKVRIAELEEEKARRDEQNEYFKLKNKELEANIAKKEHEAYMIKKVLENLIGKPIEQRFEEIELEEVRARRKAEIEAKMKDKGKGVPVEGVAQVTERAIVVSEPTKATETSILDPCPISSVSGEIDDDDEDDEEEDDDDILKDDADDVYSVHSDHDDDGNDDDDDDDDLSTSGIKVTEASNEEKIDEYLHDDANEEPENASGKGEHDDADKDDENVDQSSRLIVIPQKRVWSWMGALKANGLRRLNRVSERKYGRARLYKLDVSSRSVRG